MQTKLDPRLLSAVQKGKSEGDRVSAVVTLKSLSPCQPLAPEQTSNLVKDVLERAQGKQRIAKKNIPKVVVFERMQSFSIDAPAAMVEKVIKDQAIDSASLNH